MAEIIARFADGRLLVQEDRIVDAAYVSGTGTPIRIGLVKTVEKILSLDTYISGYPEAKVASPIPDAVVSGDVVLVKLRRGDVPTLQSSVASAAVTIGNLADITSGKEWMEELGTGSLISGQLKVLVNVIGR